MRIRPITISFMNTVHLIYAGGTFGSHGTPLMPLPADEFLPAFNALIGQKFTILPNHIIKDSSALTPTDFVHFYALITQAYSVGARHFILITGTDSLSFLGAFLSHALASLDDISVFVMGSMNPLFITNTLPYVIDKAGDGWRNLSLCLDNMHKTGVFVVVGDVFLAHNTQKIHSQANDAFVSVDTPLPTPSKTPSTDTLQQKAAHAPIKTIYLTPNGTDVLAHELQCAKDSVGVIIIAFGAGNVPSSPDVIQALSDLHQQNTPVICTSMCAFGGVNDHYGAGAWQYQHGVWSGGNLTVAGIYGKLLWLYLTDHLNIKAWHA